MKRTREMLEAAGACKLQNLGVPMEHDENRAPVVAVSQRDSMLENRVFDLSQYGGTGIQVSLALTSLVPKLCIAAIEVGLPWQAWFTWLGPDGTVDTGREYKLPGWRMGYPEKLLLNRRVGLEHEIALGESREGMLLGQAFESIPAVFKHGMSIPARFVIFDQFGQAHPTKLRLFVDRSQQTEAPRKRTERRLFAAPDKKEGEQPTSVTSATSGTREE